MVRRYRQFFVILLLLFVKSTVYAEESAIAVKFINDSAVELNALLEGAIGSGWLVYYSADPTQPFLVVHLENDGNIANAQLYDVPDGERFVPIQIRNDTLTLVDRLAQPTLTMEAQGGWWVRDERVNYNLDVQVNKNLLATWGGELIQRLEKIPDEPLVKITVRDDNADGVPDWDLRQLLPAFTQYGFIRTHYIERKCDSPLVKELGVFPTWPFVTSGRGIEQSVGSLHPPIVVDWTQGRITHFSELVTARNQNCSYTLYSPKSLVTDEVNVLSFEVPFAFYNWSDDGSGHPNVIARTGRVLKENNLIYDDTTVIRYSWRDGVGDYRWDYKVEVMGAATYSAETPIAGGHYVIDAPAWQDFPEWMMQREWPLAVFLDAPPDVNLSSEGLYEWSPTFELGDDYIYGRVDEPEPLAFEQLPVGMRGEYRYQRTAQPFLYESAVDGQLHLLGAEGGLWVVDEETHLNYYNLDGDAYVDGWQMLHNDSVMEQLFVLGDYWAYADETGVMIYEVAQSDEPALILPPTSAEKWRQFYAEIDPPPISLPIRDWLPTTSAQFVPSAQLTIDAQNRLVLQADGESEGRLLTILAGEKRLHVGEDGELFLTPLPEMEEEPPLIVNNFPESQETIQIGQLSMLLLILVCVGFLGAGWMLI